MGCGATVREKNGSVIEVIPSLPAFSAYTTLRFPSTSLIGLVLHFFLYILSFLLTTNVVDFILVGK